MGKCIRGLIGPVGGSLRGRRAGQLRSKQWKDQIKVMKAAKSRSVYVVQLEFGASEWPDRADWESCTVSDLQFLAEYGSYGQRLAARHHLIERAKTITDGQADELRAMLKKLGPA